MRRSNVVRFPGSEQPSGALLKLYGVIYHLVLGGALTLGLGISPNGLSLILLLALLYVLFIRRRIGQFRQAMQQNRMFITILLAIGLLYLVIFMATVLLVLLILAGLYWLMLGRTGKEPPYFLRFHLLTGMVLYGLVILPLLMALDAWFLVQKILQVAGQGIWADQGGLYLGLGMPWLLLVVYAAPALWLAISVIMGRTPYLPVVTGAVRHWA